MTYVSFFEQLTSSVSLSVLAIISTGILGLLLAFTVVGRLFSASKTKILPGKKSQDEKPTTANKKKHTKPKKTAAVVSSSSPNTQSEESENEKVKQTAPVRTENVQNKKQSKTTGKVDNSTSKVNTNKKQPVVVSTEAKQTPVVDVEIENNQEDEGQWVTQNNKQVNNRNRNKNKVESSPSAISNKKTASEKPTAVATTTTTEVNENEALNQTEEPIEICQLLPKNENRYTATDDWWKQPLNNQQTFSVDDIAEWPEREQDEQYIVQIKRIQPNKKLNQEN